jgi:Fe-coproporphyrin III synthase
LLLRAIEDAAREGYDGLAVSGGEPLIYAGLAQLLGLAKSLGMVTAITTNGMLLTRRRVSELAEIVDLVAVSIDGTPESHVRMRRHPRAFAAMADKLADLRAAGVPFGMLFTLTQFNVHELSWVADFAEQAGAILLQIHALHDAGAARTNLVGAAPDDREMMFAVLEALRLGTEHSGRIAIHVDVAHRDDLLDNPGDVFAAGVPGDPDLLSLADLVRPLVIEASGRVSPLLHGFHSEFELGCLYHQPLSELGRVWRRERCSAFYEHCRQAWQDLTMPEAPSLSNWYDELSHRPVLTTPTAKPHELLGSSWEQ